jgi:photosystem II stability/assembly factor-like uncharacterized protein
MKNTLRFTLALAFGLLGTLSASAQYTVLNSGLRANLNAVTIAPNGTVYVGGLTGALAKGANDGANWSTLSLGASNTDTIMGLKVLGADTLLVLTRHKLYKSLDGGATFSSTTNPFRSAMRAFAPINSNNIWVATAAEPSGLFHTYNGGLNWDSVAMNPTSTSSFLGITFPTPQVGYATGGSFGANRFGAIYRTKNGGLSWDSLPNAPQGLPAFSQQWAAHFYDAAHGVSVGAKNMLSVTADSGKTWNLITTTDNSQPYLRCIAGSVDTILTFGDAGYGRSGYFSKDFGQTLRDLPSNWVNQAPNPITGNGNRIVAVAYLNRNGYAVAGSGTVIKMTAASMGFIVSSPKAIDLGAQSIYPMPIERGQAFRVTGLASSLVDGSTAVEAQLINPTGQSIQLNTSADGNALLLSPKQALTSGTYWVMIQTKQAVYRKLVVVN